MPIKPKVLGPKEGGGRVMSATDASKAKSTPPKQGRDAAMQRFINSASSFLKRVDTKMFNDAIRQAKAKAKEADPKAYGGKTKMASGGRAKKMYGGMTKKK